MPLGAAKIESAKHRPASRRRAADYNSRWRLQLPFVDPV
jgi:hypothetical protein